MSRHIRGGGVVAGLLLLVAACDRAAPREPSPDVAAPRSRAGAASVPAASTVRAVPRLVDLGAGKCIPCKAMAPILAQLREDYAGRMDVVFIDVWQQPDEARRYGIQMIPTQIFYGADGRELARHEGFIDRDGILGAWARLGVEP